MPSFARQCPRARWDTQCGARADHAARDDHAADTCPPPTNPSPLLYSTTILSFKTRVISDIGDRRNAPCKFSLDFINPPSLRHLQSKYRSQIALLFNCFECRSKRAVLFDPLCIKYCSTLVSYFSSKGKCFHGTSNSRISSDVIWIFKLCVIFVHK